MVLVRLAKVRLGYVRFVKVRLITWWKLPSFLPLAEVHFSKVSSGLVLLLGDALQQFGELGEARVILFI